MACIRASLKEREHEYIGTLIFRLNFVYHLRVKSLELSGGNLIFVISTEKYGNYIRIRACVIARIVVKLLASRKTVARSG